MAPPDLWNHTTTTAIFSSSSSLYAAEWLQAGLEAKVSGVSLRPTNLSVAAAEMDFASAAAGDDPAAAVAGVDGEGRPEGGGGGGGLIY